MGYLGGLAIVLLLVLAVGTRPAPVQRTSDRQQEVEQSQVQTEVLQTVSYQGQEGKTVLELLEAGHAVETEKSDLGVLVKKIDGVGGDSGTFWLYYVDGQPAPMAADKYMTENGQQIEWRYEKF